MKESEILEMKREYEQRIDDLTAQLVSAEETLSQRDDQIRAQKQYVKDCDQLQAIVNQQKDEIETLNCQVSPVICLLLLIVSIHRLYMI